MTRRLHSKTKATVARLFDHLDYQTLGRIYCDEGGDAFWKANKGPCKKLGLQLAEVLRARLTPGGRSLYVGGGVAELPVLAMETLELNRTTAVYNLRVEEVAVLNDACQGLPFHFVHGDAREALETFDHVWMVSVLNDPEQFPNLSDLSYCRANPVTFDAAAFVAERRDAVALTHACLTKLTRPGLVTTSVEEIPWVTDWCTRHGVSCIVEKKDYPTAIVQDPVCFVRIGER